MCYDKVYHELLPFALNCYPHMDYETENLLISIVRDIGERHELSLNTMKIILLNYANIVKNYGTYIQTQNKSIGICKQNDVLYTDDIDDKYLNILENMFKDYNFSLHSFTDTRLLRIGKFDLEKLLAEYPNLELIAIRDSIIESSSVEELCDKLNCNSIKEKNCKRFLKT